MTLGDEPLRRESAYQSASGRVDLMTEKTDSESEMLTGPAPEDESAESAIGQGENRTRSLLSNWRHVMQTGNPPESGELDIVSRWLVLTRAAVQPMTITAAAVAGLIAAGAPTFNLGLLLIATVGIVLAHAANNLMNDLFDMDVGADTGNYPRALYAPHPVLSGMISRRGLIIAAAIVNLLDLAILIILTAARGWPIIVFALSGFFISYAYQAPPLRLKRIGLGEPSVFLVWGPLMVGGTYYAAVGSIDWHVFVASVPYGILCTGVLMAKHIDKSKWDAEAGIRTIPVLLGDQAARTATIAIIWSYFGAVLVAVATRSLSVFALATFLAMPLAVKVSKVLKKARPESKPDRWPIWPLWFVAWAFLLTRRAGALLIAGLLVGAIVGF